MELQELRALCAVVEEGNFRAAAHKLHYSPSALGRYIHQLETDIGTQLVERQGRSVAVTAAGRAFALATRRHLDALDHATEVARRQAVHGVRRLRIGHNGASTLEILRRRLPTLMEQEPSLSVELHEATSAELIGRLVRRESDLAFVRPPVQEDGLADRWLLDEQLCAAVPTPQAAGRSALHLFDLRNDRFILPPRSHSTRARGLIVDACLEHGGFEPAQAQEATSTASILALVAAGAGVSILPRRSIKYYRTPGVTSLKLLDALPPLPLHIAWRTNDDSPTSVVFRQAILVDADTRRSK